MKKTYTLIPIKGHGRGRKIGVPTINFNPRNIDIPFGIYAGIITDDDKKYKSAIHFGPRPLYKEEDPSFEVFIIQKDLPVISKKKYTIEVVGYIREIMDFKTEKDMVKQIEKDVLKINQLLLMFED